jgi:protein required for attachment to host cells
MAICWILVSDAARARLFCAAERDSALVEVACYTNPELRGSAQAGGRDQPLPRTHDSLGPGRHAIEPHTSRRTKNARQFASALVDVLSAAHDQRQFQRLFLVAPPQFLGMLREAVGNPETIGLTGEIGRDYVALSPAELHDQLHTEYPHEFHATPARLAS